MSAYWLKWLFFQYFHISKENQTYTLTSDSSNFHYPLPNQSARDWLLSKQIVSLPSQKRPTVLQPIFFLPSRERFPNVCLPLLTPLPLHHVESSNRERSRMRLFWIFFDNRRERVVARNKGIFRLRILVEKDRVPAQRFTLRSLLTCAPRAGSSSPPRGRESGFPHARSSRRTGSGRRWARAGIWPCDPCILARSTFPRVAQARPVLPSRTTLFFSFLLLLLLPFSSRGKMQCSLIARRLNFGVFIFFFSCCYFLLFCFYCFSKFQSSSLWRKCLKESFWRFCR